MSGGIWREEDEVDCLIDLGGGGGEEEDPLGDLTAAVKCEPGWMTGRGDNREIFGAVARKRKNDKIFKHLDVKRNKIGEPGAYPQVSLLDNCIFCLKKTMDKESSDLNQDAVPRATSNPSLLSTFNQVWPYLLRNRFEESENLISFIVRNARESSEIHGFTQLPTMCNFCGGKLKSVDTLLKSLGAQLKKLSDVILESRSGGEFSERAEEFEKQLRSSTLGQETLQATLHLVFGNMNATDTGFNESSTNDVATHSTSNDDLKCSTSVLNSPVSCVSNIQKETEGEDCSGSDDESESDPDYIKSEQEDVSSVCTEEDESEEETPEMPPPPKKRSWNKGNNNRSKHKGSPNPESAENLGKGSPVTCDICGRILGDKYVLAKHKLKLHNVLPPPPGLKCDLCSDLVQEKDILEHVREHVGEEYIIKCPNPKCSLVVAQPTSLWTHLQKNNICRRESAPKGKVTSKNISICEVCGHTAKFSHVLRSHMTAEHENDKKNYSCPISGCEQRFTVKQSVVLHLPYHDFSSWLTSQRCDLCSEQIKLDKIEEHLKDKHQVSEIIKCKQCSFLFSSREHLIDHLYDHRYGDLQCDLCDDGVKYSQHAYLQSHYFKVHKIGVQYSCQQCDKVFWKNNDLMVHKRLKHKRQDSSNLPEEKRLFRCEECEAEYKTQAGLKEHKIREHGAKPFSCTFCPEKFPRRDHLLKHVRKHRGVTTGTPEIFKCEVEGCGKSFKSKKSLKWHHSVTHLGERPHVCDLCGKSFTGHCGLRAHKESVHLGLRPYVCDICGESFTSGTSLKRHKMVHTGERPFPCEICGQRFRQKEVLNTHLEGHARKGSDFKPNGPMKQVRKRVEKKDKKYD